MAPYLSSLCKNLYASCGDCHLWADVYRPKKVHWSCKLEVSIPVGWCPLPYQLLNLVDITCGANDEERTSVVTSAITLVYLPVDDRSLRAGRAPRDSLVLYPHLRMGNLRSGQGKWVSKSHLVH